MGRKMGSFKSRLPYFLSFFFLAVTLIKLILLCVFANEALKSMVTILGKIVELNPTRIILGICICAFLLGLWFVFLCFVDIIAMATIDGHLSKYKLLSKLSFLGSFWSVLILSFILRLQTIIWALVLTLIGIVSALSLIIISAMKALCEEMSKDNSTSSTANNNTNSNCIDLSALTPVVKIVTDKQAKLQFCDAERISFCSGSGAGRVTFVHLYVVGVLILLGTLHFLTNMIVNRTRYHQLRATGKLN